MSVGNWEYNRGSAIIMIPKIVQFLGYDPFDTQFNTFWEKIKDYKRKQGLSIKKMAKILGIDLTTFSRWEKGINVP